MGAPLFSARIAHALLSQSPRHAWTQHPELNPDYVPEESAAFDLGKAVHRAVLGKGAELVTIDADDWRTKAAKDARDAARADGKTPLLSHQVVRVQAMVSAIVTQLGKLDPVPFKNGMAEVSIFFQSNGVACRATPDWREADNRTIDDLKTVGGNCHPAVFSRTLWDKGYDLQCVLYQRALRHAYGVDADFRFIVCETEPPYAVSVVSLDPEGLEFANRKLDRALEIWKACLAANEWPAYPTRTCFAEVPGYLQAQWLERTYYDGGFSHGHHPA